MIIKSFTADTSAAALKIVREQMGGNAVVLKTRPLSGQSRGRGVEITACLESPTAAQSSRIFPDKLATPKIVTEPVIPESAPTPEVPTTTVVPRPQPGRLSTRFDSIERKLDMILAERTSVSAEDCAPPEVQSVCEALVDADVPIEFIASLAESLQTVKAADSDKADIPAHAREELVARLSEMMLPSIEFNKGDTLVFFGPAGAGKSSVLGKLAASLVTSGKLKVRLATLDDIKLGAHEEIRNYADFLGLPVVDTDGEDESARRDRDVVTLIDAPGLPHGSAQIEKLAQRIDAVHPDHRFLVFSSLTRSRDIIDLAHAYKSLDPSHVIVTMTDLSSRYGSLVAAATGSGVKIAFTTNSPGGIGTVNAPDPDFIARNLLNVEVRLETSASA